MLTIIHGDDISSSRKFFLEQKKHALDFFSWEGENVTLTDLAQLFAGGELFTKSKMLFVEHFITKQKKRSDYKALIVALEQYGKEHTIVLWEGKELERSSLTPFKSATIRPFKLPQTLFVFLDNIKPGNDKQLMQLFHKTIETTDVEMVFFMLVRQFRLLLTCLPVPHQGWGGFTPKESDHPRGGRLERSGSHDSPRVDGGNSIDELKRMQPWQKSKLEKQAALFGIERLIDHYKQLFIIETNQKTGKLTSSLIQTIDFFLIEV